MKTQKNMKKAYTPLFTPPQNDSFFINCSNKKLLDISLTPRSYFYRWKWMKNL